MAKPQAEIPAETFNWIREKYRSKGKKSLTLKWQIEKVCEKYPRLTVRALFYRLVSAYGHEANQRFYQRVVYHSKKMRRVDSLLSEKFLDPTRQTTVPPFSYKKIVLFVEKDTIRIAIAPLLVKYRLSTLVLRGYGSLTAFQRGLARCKKKGTELILIITDLDCSGLDIQRCIESEMDSGSGIRFVRLAVTMEQVKKYELPSRKVNLSDPRAQEFLRVYGNNTWEFEAFEPPDALKVIEAGFKKHLPKKFLEEARRKELAVKAALPIEKEFVKMLRREAYKLARLGWSRKKIRAELTRKYGMKKS